MNKELSGESLAAPAEGIEMPEFIDGARGDVGRGDVLRWETVYGKDCAWAAGCNQLRY
jgi:hypothetical protein